MSDADLFLVSPVDLEPVRTLSHSAIQWASLAARANLDALDDDSHSNLGWDEDCFALLSRELDGAKRCQLGFGFATAALLWVVDGNVTESLTLSDASERDAMAWCNERLSRAGLRGTGEAELPYQLPSVDYTVFSRDETTLALRTLGAWFSLADKALNAIVEEQRVGTVLVPTVRCWPHHYDLAVLFVLDEGDPEKARSVGVGLSPGDGSYAEPYFYCTPWPTPAALPEPAAGMRWHTDGFTSMVCRASQLAGSADARGRLEEAAAVARGLLG